MKPSPRRVDGACLGAWEMRVILVRLVARYLSRLKAQFASGFAHFVTLIFITQHRHEWQAQARSFLACGRLV